MNENETVEVARARALIRSGVGRTIRRGAGLSLTEMGESLGVGPSTLHRWECLERVPRAAAAIAYARLLRRLLAGEDDD